MKILVPLAEGFEEIEFTTIVDILRRSGITVTVAGLKEGPVRGARGVTVIPDTVIEGGHEEQFDAIVLPGGYPGYENLGRSERLLNIIKKMNTRGKYIAAICGAPAVLSKAGVLKGKTATIYPGKRELIKDAKYSEERVVIDGKIITSRAAGTAMQFALKLIDIFCGKEKMDKVKQDILVE